MTILLMFLDPKQSFKVAYYDPDPLLKRDLEKGVEVQVLAKKGPEDVFLTCFLSPDIGNKQLLEYENVVVSFGDQKVDLGKIAENPWRRQMAAKLLNQLRELLQREVMDLNTLEISSLDFKQILGVKNLVVYLRNPGSPENIVVVYAHTDMYGKYNVSIWVTDESRKQNHDIDPVPKGLEEEILKKIGFDLLDLSN